MIVIGVDVHKQSVTAVAVDEAGRMLDEKAIQVGSEELLARIAADVRRSEVAGPKCLLRRSMIRCVTHVRAPLS